ncbi:hypothetical protein [Komagataeibacter diospyri]|uniref:Uncharacterized protein n=1 Tax=Komagataeibacter diospyri TaxID=1932662 RepID=A0A4P5NWS9_9PROT|nr:hypothetical protein [Komagataeibacter diospyri]GCE84421.1 hypothetical protein MSKU9_2562 [Komagataeibacter diospyri]GCE91264.1 hypothetical protein MSKU15_2865 [Komagataeibacter diospyri]
MNVSDIIMPPGQEVAPSSSETGQDPVDRLELALNRIAFALDRRAELASIARPSGPEVDVQALAANIDVLIARVRDVLGEDEADSGKE